MDAEQFLDGKWLALWKLAQELGSDNWYSLDGEDVWQLFRSNPVDPEYARKLKEAAPAIYPYLSGGPQWHPLQVIKAPKHNTPYQEYWPSATENGYIIEALNEVPKLLEEIVRLRQLEAKFTEIVDGFRSRLEQIPPRKGQESDESE